MPKSLRDQVGLTAGEVDISRDGASLRIEPVAGTGLQEHGNLLLIPSAGSRVNDQTVRALRDADQR